MTDLTPLPVFHSRAEMIAAARALPSLAHYSLAHPMPPGQHEGFILRLRIMEALQHE